MDKKTVEINYDNLEECESIIKKARSNLSSLSSQINNLNNYIYSKSDSIDISSAKEVLKESKTKLADDVIDELRKSIALIRMIKIDFASIEKKSNKKVEISEEKYKKIISKYSRQYDIPNPNNSVLKGVLGTGIGTIMANSMTSIQSSLISVVQKKEDTNSKKNDTTTNAATNNTSSGTTSKTTKSNSATIRTNSTLTNSGTTTSPAVAAASTNAIATLSLTPSVNNKPEKDKNNNKRKIKEKIPNDPKKPTNDTSDDTKKPTNDNSDDTKTPTNNTPDDTKKPTNDTSNDNKPTENNTTVKPDTPPSEQAPNSKPSAPTKTEIQPSTQEKQPVQTTVNQNVNSNSSRSFVANTSKNNQPATLKPNNQPPTTETTSPSTSLSDSVNNGNTTNLFDTNVEDFSDIEESISSIGSDSKTGGSGVIPVVAGLGAAATVGIGAKVYKDRKENNDLDLNEDRPSNENKFWTTDDSMVIHSEKDEYDINADYPTTEEPASYTAIDNSLDEDQKDSWEMPEINNDSQIIDLLGNE